MIKSWKTTSAGIAAIVTGIVGVIFAITGGTLNEAAITAGLSSVLLGIGLIFAPDATAVEPKVETPEDAKVIK